MTYTKLHQFFKFISVGVVNSLIGLSLIYTAKWFFLMGDLAANLIGYTVGLFISFSLNSKWTFAYKGNFATALIKFSITSIIAYGMNLVTVLTSIEYLGINSYLAQALGIPVFTVASYFMSKYLVFRNSNC
ncbi:hypothetical protein CKO12_11105 [Chromatium okenii]|uniref:GtrA family protein n=1 Tax=Chromatium okenii TaxID=61644 RepID=UPI001908BEC8|nr:GtrA family protein [Chromatium okenii]MBK1642414.1 hypothetical protein [Chromatium okenii]